MADLFRSLIYPRLQRPQESQQASPSSTINPPLQPIPAPESQHIDLPHAGLPIEDTDSYLANCQTTTPPSQSISSKKTSKSPNATITSPPDEPVLIGSNSSHHVSALFLLCQAKGLPAPEFEIDGQAGIAQFGGVLRIGEVTVASDKYWKSKKEVKEALAEEGVEIAKGMESRIRSAPSGGGGESKNWVGMLHEYCTKAFGAAQSPIYQTYAIDRSFSATCTLASYPDHIFGSSTTPFGNKKAAQANAAKEAVELLILEGKCNRDGSPLGRKKVKLGVAVRLEGSKLQSTAGASHVQKVNDLSILLGLHQPQYHLEPSSPNAPNMLCGYVSFSNAPQLPPKVGEVRNIFGKKTAREEIAKGAWEVLREMAQRRGFLVEEVEQE